MEHKQQSNTMEETYLVLVEIIVFDVLLSSVLILYDQEPRDSPNILDVPTRAFRIENDSTLDPMISIDLHSMILWQFN